MPLFMDRHDIPGITAEEVAQTHVVDLALAPKYGVQFLAYWFDADAGAAFCLAKASTPEDLTAVHRQGHGLVPNTIIPVVEDNVLRFLGRIEEPVDRPAIASAFRTILFTDLEGSTALLNEIGQVGLHAPADGARPDHPARAGGRPWARGEAHRRRDDGVVR